MEHDKILLTIKKCLALGKSGNEHEAAAAMAKAQELLFKYNLSIAQVDTVQDSNEKKTKTGHQFFTVVAPKNQGDWKRDLIHRIAQYNFCDLLYYGKHSVYIIGKPYNVLIVQELYLWIESQMIPITAKACRYYTGYDRVPTFRRSFLQAAVMTIGNRLYRQWSESQQESAASTALVVTNKADLEEYKAEAFPNITKGRSSRGSGSYDGHRAGMEAGNGVSIKVQKKVGADNTRRLN